MSLDLYIELSELYFNKLIKYKNILSKLFIAANKYHKHYEEVREKYKLKEKLGLNFFTLISKNYHHENYHSNILKIIFTGDLNKDIVINKDYFRQFLLFIGLKDCDKKDFVTNITCTREEKRIDILIKSGKKAIIIENKINGAVDQPNQLARYLEALEEEKFEVIKIVYLTLTEEKRIDFSTYSDEYKKYIRSINSKLVYLVAVDQPDKDFIGFLDKCIEIKENNQNGKPVKEEFKIFLKHYRNLIMHLGGEIMMRNFQKELVEKIYSKKENIKAFDDFKDLLKNEALMRELRSECVLAEIKKKIPEYIDHPYGCTIYRKWNNDFAITCYIYDLNISYGFITLEDEPQFSTDTRKKLKEVLNTDCFNKLSNEEVQEGGQNPEWIFRNFDKDDINNYTTQEIVDMVTKVLRLLEEKSKHLLEDSNTV